jgi:glucose/arabinose dehydrogenase
MRASALATAVLLAACHESPGIPVQDPGEAPALTRTVVVSGLASPWDLALPDDSTIFFTEKCAGLSVRQASGTVTRLFGASGALPAADLVCEGQSGVNGVALDPDFANNRLIYVYMSSDIGAPPRTNRVVRLELDAGYTTAGSRTDIITDIAFKELASSVGPAGAHSGGRIRFGPDGYLYVTSGDNHNAIAPQSPTVLAGKIFRVTTSGAAAPGNAPPPSFDTRVYTYGHRNPQGIDFRPGTGQPFIAEHGPNHSDEVTALVVGGNGGWDPQNRAGLTCPHGYCGYAGNVTTMPMTDLGRFPAAMRPRWTTGGSSQGMGPAVFLEGPQWGDWNGRLAVGLMATGRLIVLELSTTGLAISTMEADLPAARYRALTLGPDGNLYIATDEGAIWRVVPTP